MSLNSSKLLVFGLGVAAAVSLVYKFSSFLFSGQRQGTGSISLRRQDRGRCLAESRLSTSSELLNDKGSYLVKGSKKVRKTSKCWTINRRKRNDVTDIGIQCCFASPEVVSTEVQCNEPEEENQMVVMNLKLAHTNIFMLKKHFDEDLSKQIEGDLKVAFHRSHRFGNYIFLQGSTADMTTAATFCAKRYNGENVTRRSIQNELYFENSVSFLTVVGKASPSS